MSMFDFYGLSFNNDEFMIEELTNILRVKFKPHESSFWGDYFLAEFLDKGEVKLLENFHVEDGEWHYPDYKEFAWILEVSKASDMNYIFRKLSSYDQEKIKFLYRSEVEPLKSYKRYNFENNEFVMIAKKDFISK